MEYLTLKNSDLKVSRLCMGGCPMGEYGWGKVVEQDLISAVNTAVDKGVTFFDTADTYGLGKSEELLGMSLGQRRKDVVINTKFGVRFIDGKTVYDNTPEWIEEACNASLKRLGTDYIDIYTIHYRDVKTPLAEVIDALQKLRKCGKVRYFGLSNIYKDDIEELKKHIGEFVSFQDEYSLAQRKNEDDLFLLSDELKLSPMTWGSLGQGILSGKYDKNTVFGSDDRRSRSVYVNFHGERLLKNLEIVEVMKQISVELKAELGYDVSLTSIAIRFILDHIPDSVVLAGIKNPAQITMNTGAFGWHLNDDQLDRLEDISK